MSLAEDLGARHEPFPRILDISDEEEAHGILESRFMDGEPVVDAAQSRFIDYIVDGIDPDPEFVWIVRDPLLVVESLLLRSSILLDHDEAGWKSLFPKRPAADRLVAFCDYWVDTNIAIFSELPDPKSALHFVEDLRFRMNEHPPRPRLRGARRLPVQRDRQAHRRPLESDPSLAVEPLCYTPAPRGACVKRRKAATVADFPKPPSQFLEFKGDPGSFVAQDEIVGIRMKGGVAKALILRGGHEVELSQQYSAQKVLDMISEARKS